MGIKEAISHVSDDPETNCESTVVHALLPHLPLWETIQSSLFNRSLLPDVEHTLRYEFSRNGYALIALHLPDDAKPSELLSTIKTIIKGLRVDHPSVYSPGTMMYTKDESTDGGIPVYHTIGIVKTHAGRKATIIDTIQRNGKQRKQPLLRKVRWSALDRRIVDPNVHRSRFTVDNPRAIGFIASSFEEALVTEPMNQALFQTLVEEYHEIHQQIFLRSFRNWNVVKKLQQTRLYNGRSKKRGKRENRLHVTQNSNTRQST